MERSPVVSENPDDLSRGGGVVLRRDPTTDPALRDLARLAALSCDAAIASVELVEGERLVLAPALAPDLDSVPVAGSPLSETITGGKLVVVPDLRADPRTADGPLATASYGGRFYAGVPLPPGSAGPYGTILVLDREPRAHGLTGRQTEAMALLAKQVRRHLEQDARSRGAETYQEVFQRTPVDLALVAVEPDGNFRYKDVNLVHRQAAGFAPRALIGRTPEEVYDPPTASLARAKYEQVLATGQPIDYEFLVRSPTGERVRRSHIVPLKDGAGHVTQILLTSVDLAELQRVEAELRQAQKMEAVGRLTGGIAHDFNNLLTVILGSLHLLGGRLKDQEARQRVEVATSAAQRGADLTRRLLAVARRQNTFSKPTDVNAVLRGLHELLQRTLGGLVQVTTSLTPDLWPARADAVQLEHVILNLAINARDAMAGGGRLTIATKNVALAASADLPAGDYVRITVADEGEGMPPEVLERAFEPFFTTKQPGKGSGLGLAQAHGIITLFGGTVRLRSTVAVGTTVE
ncbi:MAG: ATP-binding protein, partial [Pseudomonadota bacterium]|nr:ATP-binding protein [Pseudomonadota bacterium]